MELEVFRIIWIAAAAVVATGWLVVSFTSPSRNRTRIEWIAATAMYVGLLSFFVYLLRDAHADGSHVRRVAFGFLCVLFGGGLLVSLWNTISALGSGSGKTETNATH